jgi:hypothetical protein
MEPVTFPYVIVRYQRDNLRLPAVVVCYAVSLEHAAALFQALIALEAPFDPMALYAIRETAECVMCARDFSMYSCGCGKSL